MTAEEAALLPDQVVAAFRLDSPATRPIEAGQVSRVFRAAQGGRPVAVRQSPWFRTLDEVHFECRTLTALHAADAPVTTPVGEPTTVDGHVWLAFEWADGTHPVRPVDDPGWYGRLLAAVHNASARAGTPSAQRPLWCRVDQFLHHPRAGGSSTLGEILPRFEAETGETGAWFRRIADEVHERLDAADLDSCPRGVVQGDFGPHQILRSDEAGTVTVIDWDFCHHDLFLADLGIGTSLARPTVDRAATMLTGYLSEAETEPGDLALLGDLRSAFHLNNLGNQLCALWANGIDVQPQLRVIRQRLQREQWWGPVLASSVREHRPARYAFGARELTDLEVAHELGDRASVVARHYFAAGVRADTKPDNSPVTVADRAIEAMLREALGELRPADAVLGEEFGQTGAGPRTWILDPIDGTSQFTAGLPHWRIQIALREADDITVAVVDEPANDVRWWATSGGGAFEALTTAPERQLAVSDTGDLHSSRCAVHPAALRADLPPETVEPPPSPLPLIELLRGEIDAFYVDCCQIWDHAPWILLIEEAGGRFTDHAGGHRPDRRGGLYSNRAVHEALLARLEIPVPGVSGPSGPAESRS